jgi:hypothetical protein
MAEIRIERRISIKGGYLLAEVHLCLPLDEDESDLHSALVRLDKEVWGLTLSPRFGVLDTSNSTRCVSIDEIFPLAVESISDALEWVNAHVEDALKTLREVLAEYKTIALRLPQLEPLIFDLNALVKES